MLWTSRGEGAPASPNYRSGLVLPRRNEKSPPSRAFLGGAGASGRGGRRRGIASVRAVESGGGAFDRHLVHRAGGRLARLERDSLPRQKVLRPVAVGELGPRAHEEVEVAVGGRDRDWRPGGRAFERRIGVMGEPLEEREVGQGREQAAGHDDLLPPDLIRQPAEEDEKRRADEERKRDQQVGGLERHL